MLTEALIHLKCHLIIWAFVIAVIFFFLLFGHILLEIASSALKVECILRGVRQPFLLLSEGTT